jgi:hypothetical protein
MRALRQSALRKLAEGVTTFEEARVPGSVALHGNMYPYHMTLKARVHNGRIVVDEPTKLPEGTEADPLPLDPGGSLDSVDRAALHRALAASQEDFEAGRLVDAEEVLRELRNL